MTAPTPTPDDNFGITVEEFAQAATQLAAIMPEIPMPSRWTALKNWFRA